MTILDTLHETYSALSGNKIRSGLTMLGIIIGISSVIAMVAIGQGAQSSVESSIQSIGSNLILVSPGAQRGPGVAVSAGRGSAQSLTLADAEAIQKEITSIKGVSAEVSKRYQVTARGQNTNTQVMGVLPSYPIVRNVEVSDGTFIASQNISSVSKVAVLGPTTRDDLFGADANAIGQSIRINKIDFKVIGVTKAKGGSGFSNQDDMVFIPLSTAQLFLTGNQYVSTISIAAADANSTTIVQQQVTDLLLAQHHISNPAAADFSTLNQADIIATASSVTNIFTMLLASVAAISLVVGGIGIMNMMLTTVTERTKEIGLRKAIGEKKSEISLQFLLEAIALTFIGGLIGVILGWAISYGVTLAGVVQTKVTLQSVLLAFGVSAGIGIIFGYYPARRASNLNPIDALRSE